MDNKEQNKLIRVVSGLAVLLVVFFIGNYVGKKSNLSSSFSEIPIPSDVNITSAQFEPFWKVWKVLNEKYVAATSTDSEKRVWGAIQGLAASQGDPYTVFFPPEESKIFKSDITGNFEGIGMEFGMRDGLMTVVAPLKGSPAEKADLRTGDIIIKINGESTSDISTDKAVKLIRGPKGTKVTLTIVHKDSTEQLDKVITRDVIDIPTIETEVKSSGQTASGNNEKTTGLRSDGIFVIRLFSFTAQAPNLFRNALKEFIESDSHKLIVDLRGNPGGYLDAAWDMASWFLPVGKVIVTEDFGGKNKNVVYRSKGYNIFNKNLKMVILVDEGSASASEIFAGALHEHGIATLIGTKTFGKGSVQELVEITPETSLKVTIARWLTPNGHNLSHEGLTPDIEVKKTQDDTKAGKDPVMDKAVEFLKKQP